MQITKTAASYYREICAGEHRPVLLCHHTLSVSWWPQECQCPVGWPSLASRLAVPVQCHPALDPLLVFHRRKPHELQCTRGSVIRKNNIVVITINILSVHRTVWWTYDCWHSRATSRLINSPFATINDRKLASMAVACFDKNLNTA